MQYSEIKGQSGNKDWANYIKAMMPEPFEKTRFRHSLE
jgi:hypothetical protein